MSKNSVLNILHEDAGLLVVNKPAGLVCHPTKGDEFSSLISRARLHLKPSTLNLQPSTHLINRLDRETSGVVLIAKSSGTAGELGKIWETRAVQKEYLAIVHGHVRDDHGLIDAPLGRDERSRVAIKDCVRPDGMPAQTEYWVEQQFSVVVRRPQLVRSGTLKRELPRIAPSTFNPQPSTYSLLRVIPRTGRKHQIRIHLAHLGHPIVGDKLYGGDEDLYLALVENRLTPRAARPAHFAESRLARPRRPVHLAWPAHGIFLRPRAVVLRLFKPRMNTNGHG